MDDPCANAPWMLLSNGFHVLAREGVQLSLGGRRLWKELDGAVIRTVFGHDRGMISLKASLTSRNTSGTMDRSGNLRESLRDVGGEQSRLTGFT